MLSVKNECVFSRLLGVAS